MDAINVRIKLNNLHCYDEADGPGDAEPYLWTVFFKVDGSSAVVSNQLALKGTATVVGTPGNQGNLGDTDVIDGENVPVPAAIGEYNTLLQPIPLEKPIGNINNVGGVVGVLTILMEEDNTPNAAIAKGHTALNKAVQKGLDQLIPTLNFTHQEPTQEDINKIQGQISSAVIKAIKSDVNIFEWLGGLGDMDDQIGTEVFIFSHKSLLDAGSSGIPIKRRWKNEGDWEITGQAVVTGPFTIFKRYDGIWMPGNDGRPVVWGYTLADFQKALGDHWKNGYRLAHQHSYDIGGGQRRYDGIWMPGNDGRPVVWGYTLADFQKALGDHWKNGYRLVHQYSYDIGGGQRRYDGIWMPGNDGRPVVWGHTLADFKKALGDHWKAGYRLAHQHSYDIGGGQRRYDGIWMPGNDGRPVVWGYTLSDFQKALGDHWKNSYRLAHQHSYDIGGGQRRYDGIWMPGNDGRPVVWGYTLADFQKELGDDWKIGYRLVHQDSY